MSSIRLDKVAFSTLHEAYKNYLTTTGDIVIATTSLANGASRTTSVVIPYTRAGTRADVYATNGSKKTLVTSGGRAAGTAIYTLTSTETVTINTSYSSSDITVSVVVTNNSGGPISPVAQTITISVVQYDAPITTV